MCHVSAPAAPHLATSDTNSAILNAEAQHWHKQYSSNSSPSTVFSPSCRWLSINQCAPIQSNETACGLVRIPTLLVSRNQVDEIFADENANKTSR
jgi:hypothetical protein